MHETAEYLVLGIIEANSILRLSMARQPQSSVKTAILQLQMGRPHQSVKIIVKILAFGSAS